MKSRSRRYGQDYFPAICHVDHFKSYHDVYGHPAGDAALARVAAAIAGHAREREGASRYGGGEFVLLLPNQSMADSGGVMERVRAVVDEGDPSGTLAIGAGISASFPGRRVCSEQIFAEADDALYAAGSRQQAETGSCWHTPSPAHLPEGEAGCPNERPEE